MAYKQLLAGVLMGALASTAVPAAAEGAVRFARNAGKVDGLSAVRAGTSASERAGKLVAADRDGFLPPNLLRDVDAATLGGLDASSFQHRGCTDGAVWARVLVLWVDFRNDIQPTHPYNCAGGEVTVTRMGPGSYRVIFGSLTRQACDVIGFLPRPLTATVMGVPEVTISAGLVRENTEGCRDISDDYEAPVAVELRDRSGAPVDASFSLMMW